MRPVELAFQLVELVAQHQPVGVSELARLAGLPKTTAHRLLQALHQTGWIAPDDSDRPLWALTGRAMVNCGRATRSQSLLRGVALPVMEELRRLTEETIHLTWRHDMSLVLLERLDGIRPVRYFFPYAGQATLHATSSGQAVLAALAPDVLDAYLSGTLAQVTPFTLVEPAALRRLFDGVRGRGYAFGRGGHVADVHAVGAAILDPAGAPIGAISVSAPAERLAEAEAERYGPLVADAVRRVSMGLRAYPAARSG